MPPRCVLNGLQTVPIPVELQVLDPLSNQTIVRLGTYTGNVPMYNSPKAEEAVSSSGGRPELFLYIHMHFSTQSRYVSNTYTGLVVQYTLCKTTKE